MSTTIVLYWWPPEHDDDIQTLHRLAGPTNQPFSTKVQCLLRTRIKDPTGADLLSVRTLLNLPVPSLKFCVASQRITRGCVIAARGAIQIDAPALGTGANLGLIQRECSVCGMHLPVPSTDVQLNFIMNSPYDAEFNVCRWRGHFGNGVDRSVPPRAMLYTHA